jgi:hypothetical protein
MDYYSFYNALLIETAVSEDKLSPGFIDDSMMLTTGNSLDQCHTKLKDMMEHAGGSFKWSNLHNSPFKLSKTALMDFPRSFHDHIPGNLRLDKPNMDGMTSAITVQPVQLYKYLGIIFDPNSIGCFSKPRPLPWPPSGHLMSGT